MKIDSFTGDYRFLSNFYPAKVTYEGNSYPSTEHAYQAAKTTNASDRAKFREGIRAGEAKRLGKHIKLREGWEGMKLSVMEELLRQKFTKHDDLKQRLIETGDAELVESNNWGDVWWGQVDGVGHNWLGKLLMKIRSEVTNLT